MLEKTKIPEQLRTEIPVSKSSGVSLGYSHPLYALSLRDFGEPRSLPRCGGWILERQIPGTLLKDGTGCYPLFSCRDWTQLRRDLDEIGPDLVSVVCVIDPFSGLSQSDLEKCFDIVKPYKTHYTANLSRSPEAYISQSTRYLARRALKTMDVEVCGQPEKYLREWVKLYDTLIAKHDIKGVAAFSPESFKIQLGIPGMVMFLGRLNGEIIGAVLTLIADRTAYIHLAAYAKEAYRLGASYGIYWKAQLYLYEKGVRHIHHGGAPGIYDDAGSGLAHFKKRWSNETRTAYLCGRVLNRSHYDFLRRHTHSDAQGFFPAYRGR